MMYYKSSRKERESKKWGIPLINVFPRHILKRIPALDFAETMSGKKLEVGLPSRFPACTKPS